MDERLKDECSSEGILNCVIDSVQPNPSDSDKDYYSPPFAALRRNLRKAFYLILFASTILMTGCQSISGDANKSAKIIIDSIDGPNPWSQLKFNDNPESFQFAIVTDRTGSERRGVFEQAIDKLNLLQPEFVVSVGDLIEGYTDDKKRVESEWQEFDSFIEKLEMPFFYLAGNHDITNEMMAEVWKERLGRTYYHFVYHDVLFLMLNSEDPIQAHGRGAIYDKQFEYIAEVLDQHRDVKWTLVFMHQPLWAQEGFDPGRWKDVEALLQQRKHTVFAGHHHRYQKYQRNNGKYFVLATTGGGSRLRGPNFGEFDHVVWVTMSEQGPIIANLLLEGIWDENVVDEELRGFMQPYFYGPPIEVSPIFMEGFAFETAGVEVKLTNDADIPMSVDYEFLPSEDISVDQENFAVEVSPNSVERFSFKVGNLGKSAVVSKQPAVMKATVTMALEGRPDIELSESFLLKPEILHLVPRVAGAPIIDGRIEDGPELPLGFDVPAQIHQIKPNYHGIDDAKLGFGLQMDEQFLYVGLKIQDDQYYGDPKAPIWVQDSVAIILDARPLAESSQGKGGREVYEDFQFFAISPEIDDNGNHVRYISDKWPEGSKSAAHRTPDGFTAEFAIPLSYLEEKQGKDWQHFRFNVAIDDNDAGEASRLWWRPDWRTDENYPGSGTFIRTLDN